MLLNVGFYTTVPDRIDCWKNYSSCISLLGGFSKISGPNLAMVQSVQNV